MKRIKLLSIISIILIVLLSSCELSFNKENSQKGKVWFIGYGCDYSTTVKPLENTISDVDELGKAFAALSEKAGVVYKAYYILGNSKGIATKNTYGTYCVSSDAKKSTYLDTLKGIKPLVSDNDVLIFYFSGHGSGEDDKKYSYESSTPFNDYEIAFGDLDKGNRISYGDIFSRVEDFKGKKIIISDTCYSGSFVVGGGVSVNSDVYSDNPAKLLFEHKINQSSSVWALTACTYYQRSSESRYLGHGAFTSCLLKALGWDETQSVHKLGKINCLNGNMISIGSIANYVYTHGGIYTNGQWNQIPVFSAGSSDVILFKF